MSILLSLCNPLIIVRYYGGILLVLLSNLSYICNNYIVKLASLSASEVSLVRGTLQVLVFSGIIVYRSRQSSNTEATETDYKSIGKKLGLIALHGFFTSTLSFNCVFAISLMPISDLIVIGFSSPMFSVFLESFFLKRKLTVLSLIIVVIIGI